MNRTFWRARTQNNKGKAEELARRLDVLPLTASLLLSRGIEGKEEGERFLFPVLSHLTDPFLLPDMPKAVERIRRAIIEGEAIFLQGDYDVDGICATALLAKVIANLGGRVFCYLPQRLREGHGISSRAVEKAKEIGAKLYLTVDCGSASWDGVRKLNGLGIDVVITDHHEVEDLPPAYALVNPKLLAASSPLKDLAGVGVAFKVAQALYKAFGREESRVYDKLDLVALGTIADLVPLLGENRIMVKAGLERLAQAPSPGLEALKNHTRLSGRVDPRKVSFILAPRLNAPGRISYPHRALELLICNDIRRGEEICRELERLNRKRQEIETEILREVERELERADLEEEWVLVVKGKGWHRGLLGLVASKIVEAYQRPVFVFSLDGGIAKGSGRSIHAFNLFKAVTNLSHLLLRYGGHSGAVGVELREENLEEFRGAINEIAKQELSPEDLRLRVEVEDLLSFREITPRLARELSLFPPFGVGNPQPLFISEDVKVKRISPLSNGKHMVVFLEENGKELPSLLFNPSGPLPSERISILYAIEMDKQLESPILILKEWTKEGKNIIREVFSSYMVQPSLWSGYDTGDSEYS